MFFGEKKEEHKENPEIEYPEYEIIRKSKVGEYLQNGTEFFVVDMDKKKVYRSQDLRIREIVEKVDKPNTFLVKEVEYC